MKKRFGSKMQNTKRTLLIALLLTSTVLGQSFTTTGGTVTSGYWNASNTGGTFSFVIPNDNTISFLALNIDVNDAEAYAEIGAQEFGVSAQQSKSYTRTATEIETAGSFSDGDTYDIHVIFYKTSGGIAAVDTLTLATDIEVDETAPADFTVGAVTASGGNVTGGYWNDTNTQLSVTVPIANDASLQGGSLQITGFVGGNPAEDLGTADNVLIISTNQTVDLADTDFVDKVWFLDNQTFSLNATLFDAAGNSTDGTASATTLTIDQTAPTISSITSSTADGTYGVGETVNVTVTFDEAVTLSNGSLLTDLNAGAQLTTGTISNATSFSEDYTVSEGDDAASLNVTSFSFSGGTTKLLDAAGNNADLATISSNLEDNTDIVVDGSTPSVSSITTTTDAGSYGVDETVNITVTFTEALTLSGGNLLVSIDASASDVTISPFSSSTTATGTYTVADGDASSALNVTGLSLSGGTLVDAGGNSVDLDLTGVSNIDDQKTVAIDGAGPADFTVSTVTVTGGTVVAGYWNSTNTGLSVVVPVANDATLNGGTVQVQGYFGDISGAADIGTTSALNGSHLGGSITVNLDAADVEALVGFADDATLKITAILADAGGNSTTGTQSANTFAIDQTSPVLSSISSSTANGTYGIGDAVNVTLSFSENVTLANGNLETTLNTGTVLEENAISDANSSSQTYTISALDETSDVTVSGLALSGGTTTLNDAAGNPTDLSLPASNLATTSEIVIDGIVPTVSSIVTTTDDGSFGVGDVVNITVNFSEAVTLSGGNLVVDHDASDTDVSITSISSATSGTVDYTVADGDASNDLTVTALSLSAGTLQDAGGNDVDLTDISGITNIDDGSDIFVDGAAPADFTVGAITVTGGDVVSGYWNATNTGMSVVVPIANDIGLVDGTVQLQGYFNVIGGAVDVGDPTTIAGGNLGGNLTMTLTAVQIEAIPGFTDDEVLKITAVMTDDGGNATTGTQSANEFTIDQTAPTLSTITSTTADGTYGVGDGINLTFTFDENVTLAGGNLISTLNTGATVTTTTVSDEATVSQTYTIAEGEEETDLAVTDLDLSVGTASLTDAAGNEAVLTLPADDNVDDSSDLVIDGIYPTLSSISSTSSNGSYGVDQEINITITFSEAVTLSGGNLEVDIDASTTDVLITSISSSSTASGTYTVGTGDDSDDLTVDALSLSAGTLQDAGGNDVDLSDLSGISNIADSKAINVDGDAPAAFQVSTVLATGGTVVADYWNSTNTGLNVTIPIANDASLVNGKVLVLARVGSNSYEAIGDSSTISAVNTDKVVSLSNLEVEGITGYAESAELSFAAMIRDDVYNYTTGTASATTITVDEVAPTISTITSNPATGTLGVASTADITVAFSEAVTLAGGNVVVTLETGDTDATLTESDINAASTFTETYTVVEDEESSDLDVTSVALSSGTLRDAAGNEADRTLPVGTNLADNSALVVDGVIPTLVSITSSSDDTEDYPQGAEIDLVVTFSENVTLAGGNLRLTMDTGTAVDITSLSNTNTATVTYTVVDGDASSDLSVSSIGLTAGTLVDAGSNDVTLTIPSGGNLDDAHDFVVDGSPPSDFTVGSVVTTGGNIVAGYWNSTNTGLDITVPIEADNSLQNGKVIIMGRVGANAYEAVGDSANITVVPDSKTISLSAAQVEAITGYGEGVDLSFTAVIRDISYNYTTGTASVTTLSVDEVVPSISSISSDTGADELSVGETADITITFSEDVTLAGGNLVTTLETGDTDAQLTTTTIAATDEVTETYTVTEDESTSDLTVSSIALSAGTLRDAAGNDYDDTLPVGNNLGDNVNIEVDGIIPTIVSITSTSDDADDYPENSEIDLVITFSEQLSVPAGTMSLIFDTGQSIVVDASTNSLTTTATYIVQSGDESSDLSTTSLTVGLTPVTDSAGNDLDTTIPADGGLEDAHDFVVDGAVPTDFTVGAVTTTGGTVVSGYWNDTNLGLDVVVPIDADLSLQGGRLQVIARTGSNSFENLGADVEIDAVGPPKTMSFTFSTVEGITGYAEGAVVEISAILTDDYGNATTGTASATTLTVDTVDPTIQSVTSVPFNADLQVGGSVDITITFSEDVTLATDDLVTTLDSGGELTTTAIAATNTVTETYTVAADENSSDLTVTSFDIGLGTLRDAAGNDIDTSLPAGNNLADNSQITVDGTIPTIERIGSATSEDTLGVGESLVINMLFSEPLTLSGGNLVLTLDNGGTAEISPFFLTTEPSATYTVQAGEESSDLSVTTVTLPVGSLEDAVGNAADLTIPTGNNLGDATEILVDGIVPDAFTTGEVLTIGDPVVTNYWNEDNTSFEVIIPMPDPLDPSLNGGTAHLQARMNNNAFADLGNTYAVTTNPVTITISEADLEGELAGFPAGGSFEVRGVLTDIAGNETIGSTASAITIDEIDPQVTTTSSLLVAGGTVYQGYWNATNTTLTVSTPVGVDNSIVGGDLQIQMSIDGGGFVDVGSSATIAGDNTTIETILTQAELNAAGAEDGDELTFIAVITDLAGNVTTGLPGTESVFVDFTFPADFTVGAVTSTAGNVFAGYFNTTNDGMEVIIPVDATDNTLVGGFAQLRARVDAGAPEDILGTQSIDDLNDLTVVLSRADIESITGYVEGGSISFDARITDAAGNTILGSVSPDAMVIDQTLPVNYTSEDIRSTGGNTSLGYWNSTNTAVLVKVPLTNDGSLPVDASLIGGVLAIEGDLNPPGNDTFETFATTYTIPDLSTDTLSISIPAAELEALNGGGFGNNLEIIFRSTITDIAGNEATSITSAEELTIDQALPAAPGITEMIVRGDNVVQGVWSSGADSLIVALPITDPDASLPGGYVQLEMSIGSTFDENAYETVSTQFTIPMAEDSIRLGSDDITALTDFADGLTLYTRVVIRDVAGNETTGSTSAHEILIDVNPPADFTAGALVATGGNVVANSFNNSNTGIQLDVPLVSDPTLIGGNAILKVSLTDLATDPFVANPLENVDTVAIIADNTTLQMTLDLAELSALAGFRNNYLLIATAGLTDYAGNEVEGTPSSNQLVLDFAGPDLPVINDTTAVGGEIVQGHWNASNTGIDVTIETQAQPGIGDTTLLGGYFQVQGRFGFENNWVDLGAPVIIDSPTLTERTANITAAEIESLPTFTDGFSIDLLINMVDGHGNDTLGSLIDDWLFVDQVDPVTGTFDLVATTTDPFINAEDSLFATWQGFSDQHSDIIGYSYSIGSSAKGNEVSDWELVTGTQKDTLFSYTHGASYFLNVRALDAAGNDSDTLSSAELIVDLNPPTSTILMEEYYLIDDWPDTLTGGYGDDLSGVDSLRLILTRASDGFSWDGSDWAADTTSIDLSFADGIWSYELLAADLENREDYVMEVTAQDSAGNIQNPIATDGFQFVINTPPVIDVIASQDVDEDILFNYVLTASDVDLGTISGDSLRYSLLVGPDSMVVTTDTLTNTGEINWTPENADVGIHNIRIGVTDDYGDMDSTAFILIVNQVNDAPEPVTLLTLPTATQITTDSMDVTFRWTSAFDIEGDSVGYYVSFFQAADAEGGIEEYSQTLNVADTFLTVDVSEMDFPYDSTEWFVVARDIHDADSEESTHFTFHTSPALAELNTEEIRINLDRYVVKDTSFTLTNLGLTDLRWSLFDLPEWITLDVDTGTVDFGDTTTLDLSIDINAFTVGSYSGDIRLVYNSLTPDTLVISVDLQIYDLPTPVLAFYQNPAYPAHYQMMIVDSLGMIDTLWAVQGNDTLVIDTLGTGSYAYNAEVEFSSEGNKTFEVYAANWTGDTTITATVSVSLLKSGRSWLARSPDEHFQLEGEGQSIIGEGRVLVLDSLLSASRDAEYAVLSDGIRLADPILVRIDDPIGMQAVYQQTRSGEYRELPSMNNGEQASAWTTEMGEFKLGPRTLIIPEVSKLAQNYPNPFNPSTTIEFDVGFLDGLQQDVHFGIYNIRGQEIRQLVNTQLQPGSYAMTWDGQDAEGRQVSSGIYFARLITGKGYIKTVKMLVLR